MPTHKLIVAGLILELLGVFLLSVEAIKLENVKVLSDHILKRLYHESRSPSIRFRDEDNQPGVEEREFVINWASRRPKLFTFLHYVAGIVLLVSVNFATRNFLFKIVISGFWFATKLKWYWVTLIALGCLYFAIAGVWILGELVHQTLLWVLRGLINLAEFIQRKWADGTVGIIGFALVFVGISLQIFGTGWD